MRAPDDVDLVARAELARVVAPEPPAALAAGLRIGPETALSKRLGREPGLVIPAAVRLGPLVVNPILHAATWMLVASVIRRELPIGRISRGLRPACNHQLHERSEHGCGECGWRRG